MTTSTYFNYKQLESENIEIIREAVAVARNPVMLCSALSVKTPRSCCIWRARHFIRLVRFRTLGCYPLTGAIESSAATLEEIVAETFQARVSERQGRLIDSDQPGSMEKKKQEGYF